MAKLLILLARFTAKLFPLPLKKFIYRLSPVAKLIRRSLNWSLPQGITKVEIVAGGLVGKNLWLDLQSEKDYWLGTYEPELQMAINYFVHPGMMAYDVGANIGYVTLLLADAVGQSGHVYAFEAHPDNVERLKRNILENGGDVNVTVISAAVTDCNQPAKFIIGPSLGMGKVVGSAGRQYETYDNSIIVPGISLDLFVYLEHHLPPDVIKIDIEGGEVLALPGMQQLLVEKRPIILIELHGLEAIQKVWELLSKNKYHFSLMKPNFPEVVRVEQLDKKAYVIGIPN